MQKATIRKYSKDEIIRMRSQLEDISVTEFRQIERTFDRLTPVIKDIDDIVDVGVSNPEEGYKIDRKSVV